MILLSTVNAYWKFDGNATDSVGGHVATNVGGVTFAAAGKINTAAAFSGTNHLSIPHAATLEPTQFSLQAWFKTSTADKWIFSKDGTNTGWRLLCGASGIIAFQIGNGTAFTSIGTGFSVVNSAWHHAVGTYNGTSARFYVDGTLIGTTAVAYVKSGIGLLIGTRQSLGDKWVGNLDELAVYNVALTQADVTGLYNAGNGLPLSSYTTGSVAKKKKAAHYRSRSRAL